jgi:membrane associated rhomboid family serine protease
MQHLPPASVLKNKSNQRMLNDHQPSVTAANTLSREKADTWSLVLWAMNIFHEVTRDDAGFHINVNADDLEAVRRELADYEAENSNWPQSERPIIDRTLSPSQPPTILLMGALLLIYAVTGPWSGGSPWFANGAVMGEKILVHHEWWRVATGLTLHGNPVHLVGNVLIGGFLVHFLLRAIGSGLGLTLILFCGAAGNAINIMAHGPHHNSVGFSTAVFATIGIMSGRQSILKKNITRTVLPPLAAGLGLLAMLGSSGEHTDLGAHLFGLLVGVVAGCILALVPGNDKLIANRRLQTILLFVGLGAMTLCWLLAFNAAP